MAPVATNFASDTGGVTVEMVSYYSERARGGAGLIIVENSVVDYPLGWNGATQLRVDSDRFVPGLFTLTESLHDAGALAAIQINHAGGTANVKTTGGLQPVGPSAIPMGRYKRVPRALTVEEIEVVVRKFADAAVLAKRAGFDAVEIHGGHGYLVHQFMSPLTNKRTDEYGGGLEGRLRFALEVVSRVREAVGPEFPIMFRISADEFVEGGMGLEETKLAAVMLQRAGVDCLHVSAGMPGWSEHPMPEPMSYSEGWRVYLAAEMKKVLDIPVIAVGVIRNPGYADAIIRDGKADFVALGRGLIADPYWPQKAFEGRENEIRRCISCNVGCVWSRIYKGLPIRCTVNPAVGREREFAATGQAIRRKRVLVVGGGPAGIEAACAAASRGHDVTIVERSDRLGGQLRLASILPHKEKLSWFLDYLLGQVKRTGVTVKLETAATGKVVREFAPDVLVVATGAEPLIPDFVSSAGNRAISAHDLLEEGRFPRGKEVIVVGAGMVGCEVAELLATADNSVTVVEKLSEPALDLDPVSRQDLLRRLRDHEVDIRTERELVAVAHDGTVYVKGPNGDETLTADLVVVALGSKPRGFAADGLTDSVIETWTIGDCRQPRRLIHAVREGTLVGRLV